MKNSKFLKKIAATIVCSAMALTAFGLAACNNDGNGGEGEGGETTHSHTYSTEWNHNGTHHWHDATCEHSDMFSDKREHTFEGGECTTCHAVEQVIHPSKSEADDEQPETDAEGNLLVNYEFYPQDYEKGTYAEDLIAGIFTVVSGTEIRTKTRTELYDDNGNKIQDVDYSKSVKLGSGGTVKINAPAAGKLTVHVQNGSSGGLTTQKLKLTKPDGMSETIEYRAVGSALQLVEIDCEKEGVYTLQPATGTSDAYYMAYTAKVQNTPVESISVGSAGNTNYYVGQAFGIDGLSVNAVHKTTGRLSPLEKERLEVDYKNFDNTKAGTYEIKVSYTKDGSTFKTSYNVNVYSFDSLKLGTDMIVKADQNSAAGNGVYANHTLRQLYFTGDTIDVDGLSVTLIGNNGTKENSFLLKDTQYKLSEVDMSTAGKKTVTVSFTTNGITREGTFEFYVIEKDAALATATSVNTVVDGTLTDANIGVKNNDGAYQFKTIHQALSFLENSGVANDAAKTINLAAGNYWEKLEINIPNLTIVGAGLSTTKIEYDSLYGIKDDGGFEHVTDSTATLNVRDAATNFTIKNVTISNYWNSQEVFDRDLGAGYGEHRALAALIQSDKVTIDNCALLGYQDTVEFFTGRQYVVNSYIAGTTDFIFGTNNTTYFENCEIHSIDNGKTDGGYITAFKGCNKGASDYVTYGAIFDNCQFTADEAVVNNGNTAIGRPWGAYAAVAVINSEIDAHVSTEGFEGNGNSKNLRYVSMSGVNPTASTVKFVEYNNTGDGAINTAVGGMRFLTETEAANYSNFSVIFGTANGGVSYSSVWIPVRPDAETHTVTVTTKDGVDLGTITVEDGSALLEDQIKAVVANNATYKAYDIVGIYSDDTCLTAYAYPEISADGNVYVELHFEKAIVSSTTINFRTDANYADLIDGGKLEIVSPTDGVSPYKEIKSDCIGFNEGVEISIDVKAGTTIIVDAYGGNYTNFTVKINGVTNDELGTVTDDCTFTVDSNCTVTFVCGANNYLKSITVDVPKTYALNETITLTDYDGTALQNGTSAKWNGITITTDNGGKFASRVPNNNDIQCNPGTVLTFNVADGITENNITVIDYNGAAVTNGAWEVTVEGGVATVECKTTAGNCNFIKAIEIKAV